MEKTLGKTWKNHWEKPGNSWEKPGKNHGKNLENHGKNMVKIMGKTW